MKRILFYLLILTGIFIPAACSEEPASPEVTGKLFGAWVHVEYQDSLRVMKKTFELEEDNYGFIIQSDGKFIERKNSGWCGTPPISYANFEGSWESETENRLNINVDFWGGITTYKIHIISLSEAELKIYYSN